MTDLLFCVFVPALMLTFGLSPLLLSPVCNVHRLRRRTQFSTVDLAALTTQTAVILGVIRYLGIANSAIGFRGAGWLLEWMLVGSAAAVAFGGWWIGVRALGSTGVRAALPRFCFLALTVPLAIVLTPLAFLTFVALVVMLHDGPSPPMLVLLLTTLAGYVVCRTSCRWVAGYMQLDPAPEQVDAAAGDESPSEQP